MQSQAIFGPIFGPKKSIELPPRSTKLFITHFGANGVFEAIWNGVPMVGMISGPGGDNHYISDLVVHHGMGIKIDPIPSEDEVWQAINVALTNARYYYLRQS